MAAKPSVVVIGAGIVGASIARSLAVAGARVTVVDAGEAGGVATRSSWAWINASSGRPEAYFRLRARSLQEWRALDGAVPDLAIDWSGSLIWNRPQADLEAVAAERVAWGQSLRLVDRDEIARMEPALADPPSRAIHVAEEGAVDPIPATLAFLKDAERHGAVMRKKTPVRRLALDGGRVVGVGTDAGIIAADEVVVAAGTATPALAATAGVAVPLKPAPGIVIRTRPHRRLIARMLVSPEIELRQMPDGRVFAVGTIEDRNVPERAPEVAAALFADVKRMLRAGDDLVLDSHATAYRPIPVDGFPAVGRAGVSGLYVAVMHSGVTLAAGIGRFAAEEILDGRRDPLLDPYGLDRFAP